MAFSEFMLMVWPPFWVTLKLAFLTTVLLCIFTTPLAFWLALPCNHRFKRVLKLLLMSVVTLPIILPPTVLGFYLLLAFSPQSLLGHWFSNAGLPQLAFSFSGLVVASMIYSLPFFMQPVYNQFDSLPMGQLEAALALGATWWQVFLTVALPQARSGILLGSLVCFAHTMGEFGVVLMIGGSIEGQTKVISIAIYEQVEAMNYAVAEQMALMLLIFAGFISLIINILSRNAKRF